MKGSVTILETRVDYDKQTGVPVKKLTDDIGDTYHSYFTQPLIDLEQNYILLVSTRSGSMQLYTYYFADCRLVQLTDDENIITGCCLDPVRHIAYYYNGNTLKSVRTDTLEEREHFRIPQGFVPHIMSLTEDGRYMAFCYTERMEELLTERNGNIVPKTKEIMFRRPSSVIFRYDTQEDLVVPQYGGDRYITHVNISSIDPDYILYCHAGPWYLVQRMWMFNRKDNIARPLIQQQHNLQGVTHEYFTNSGRVGAQYQERYSADTWFQRFADIFVNPDGSGERRFFYPYTQPEHAKINYGETLAAGDSAHIRRNMTQEESRRYISLIRYEDATAHVALLCSHNTSFTSQASHPHPIFTRDDKHVLFSSDAGGRSNLYMVEANWDRAIRWE